MTQPLKSRVLTLLQKEPGRAFKTKELARQLELPKQGPDYQNFKTVLREMQEEDLLVRLKGSRWMLRKDEDAPTARLDRHLVGTLKQIRKLYYVDPDDREVEGDIAIDRRNVGDAQDGDKVVVRLLLESRRHAGLEGEIVEVLGRQGRADVEMLALARRYGLSMDFPEDVMDEAHGLPAEIEPSDIKGRLDLRGEECFTIDPEDARDYDDAVSLAMNDDGTYRLGVHIADVSHYVHEGSALDREALRRGTSVYLVDGVFPMLPERLSNHLCSLKEGKDRLTYSVMMTVTSRGDVQDFELGKSAIHSRKRFTYEEVQGILDGGEGPHAETLRLMEKLATTLMRKRFSEGSVDFAVPEVRFKLDSTGRPIDIVPKERLMSMRVVEEFMLLANRTVARAASNPKGNAPIPFIYRVHDVPDPEKVRELLEFLRHLGVTVQLDPGSSKSFQKMVETVRGRPEENVVQDVAIRSMAKAVYSEKNIGHFGLGFHHYTHFTSPIRRYPDLIVHRLLHRAFGGGEGKMPTVKRLGDIARQSSIRERVAVEAERESVKIKQVEYMKRHEGDEFDGLVSGVTRWGLYVELIPTMVEGLVHVRSMNDFYNYDKKRMQLVGERKGLRYRLGDRVRVQVARVDSIDQEIDFVLVEEDRKARDNGQKAAGGGTTDARDGKSGSGRSGGGGKSGGGRSGGGGKSRGGKSDGGGKSGGGRSGGGKSGGGKSGGGKSGGGKSGGGKSGGGSSGSGKSSGGGKSGGEKSGGGKSDGGKPGSGRNAGGGKSGGEKSGGGSSGGGKSGRRKR